VCTDHEEEQRISEKLEMAHSCGNPYLAEANGESVDQLNAVFEDTKSNKSLWMDKVFRVPNPRWH